MTVGIAALIEGMSHAERAGWTAPATLLALGLAVVCITAFIAVESRVSDPLVRLDVFRLPGVSAGNLIIACNGTVLTATTLFVSFTLQQALGNDALGAGVRLVPFVVLSGLVTLTSAPLIARFGPRAVLRFGLLVAAIGYVWLGLPGDHPGYLTGVLGPLMVIAVGLGLTIVPSTRAAAAGIAPAQAGLASGLFNVSRQAGAAIGIAALTTLAAARTHAELAAGQSATTAGLHGDAAALLACAGLCLLAALISLTLPHPAARRDQRR